MSEFREERIKTLTQTAKGVWFGYLGALAFTGVTLLGVEDIDFFSLESATELPLIGVSVPVTSFFWAGALLLAIVYCYLHVFLEQLWVELAAAPARFEDKPIAQSVHPWLISEFALILRLKRRGEDPAPVEMSPLGYFGIVASAILGWIAGPVVLFFFWLRSQPVHSALMTSFIGLCLVVAFWAMIESLRSLWQKMQKPKKMEIAALRVPTGRQRPLFTVMAFAAIGILVISNMRTQWDYLKYVKPVEPVGFSVMDFRQWLRPVSAQLVEASLVELPSDWLTHDTAKKDFYTTWCKRNDTPDCVSEIPTDEESNFQKEWSERRATYLRVLSKPSMQETDLSFANLLRAHLPGLDLRSANLNGANLREAQLEGANLKHAQMERADLRQAQMEGANLRLAQMRGANLVGAQMEGADLIGAQMEGADLRQAQMEGVNLWSAQMEGTDLRQAQMEGANLSDAQMEGADLRQVQMEGADLSRAQMERADLRGAQMVRANLSYSILTGSKDKLIILRSTNLIASINNGGAIRFVDFTGAFTDDLTDFRNSFGDASVKLPSPMSRPCQWGKKTDDPLDDAEFYGKWRGWLEASGEGYLWLFIAPEEFRDVKPIDSPDGCEWKTEPI